MTKWIKKFAASAAIAASLASGAVMASGPANADLASNRAQLVCAAMNHEPSISHLNRLWRTTGLDRWTFSSALLYGARDFCPQHRDLVNVWVG